MTERNWSTKTLARQLVAYLREHEIVAGNTVAELMESLKSDIVEEEVGTSLDPWAEDE